MNEETLFELVLNTPEADRAALLDHECAGNSELRKRVEALLAAHVAPDIFVDQNAPGDVNKTGAYVGPQGTTAATAGTIIAGKYKLLQQIGEGGMGTVWMADQTEPVKRRVAVKLIHAERGSSRTILSRFEAERQAIALMDHPHIAKLLDAGQLSIDDCRLPIEHSSQSTIGNRQSPIPGVPYFVMELVKGIPLTDFCDAHKLSIPQRLNLFMQICSAVQHAHQKGIIHRDLKPSNILVESHDGKPVPKVIDFGLAKATSGLQLTEHTLFTGFGTVMGTPLYMSPEQAAFNAVDVDTRADVYALGVVLYELLTGTTPLTRETVKKAALDEMLKLIREQEAPTPSSRLSTSDSKPSVAANRQMEPAKLGRFVKGELDWIVLKALSKDRDRRYETANGFARDVERFLNHEPVAAGPPSARYKLRKYVRRNRPQVIAASLVVLALVAGIAGTSLGLLEARRQTELARTQEALARDEAAAKEVARAEEAVQRKRAVEFRDKALDALRATTGTDVEQLIGGKTELGANEKAYLEAIAKRWQAFATQEGTDEHAGSIRGEGNYRVAFLWKRLGRREQARPAYEQAVVIYEKLVADFPAVPDYRRHLAASHNNLGALLMDLGKWAEAQEQYNEALVIYEKLATDFPAVPDYRHHLAANHNNLGALLWDLGKRSEAEEQFNKALVIHEKLAADFPTVPDYRSGLARSHSNLGNLLAGLGKRTDAEEQYKKARVIREKLAADFPAVPEYRSDQAASHYSLGKLLADLGKWAEAQEQYKQNRVIQEKLAADFPAVPQYRRDLAASHNDLGNLLAHLGKRAEAQEQYNKSLMIQEKLAVDFPTVPDYRSRLGASHYNLGNLLAGLGKRTEAEEQYKLALAIEEKLAADFPPVPKYRVSLGGSYCNYGNMVRDGGRANESLNLFDKAIATLTPVHRDEPRDVTAKQYLRNSYGGRAMAYDGLQKYAEAAKDWDRAIELSPPAEQLGFRASRANSRLRAGMAAEAVTEVAELTKILNWNAGQWYDFACVYAVASGKIADKKQEYADRAMELLQKALKAGFKDAAHMAKDIDLDLLRGREDFKKLMAELEMKE